MDLKPVIKFCAYVFVVGVFVFLVFIVFPMNFTHSGPDKLAYVKYMLMHIQAAKWEWAVVNGYTNAPDMQRVPTQQDISPYVEHDSADKFGLGFDENGYVLPAKGIIFSINRLGISPQVTFTRDFTENRWRHGQRIPKGTTMILSDAGISFFLQGEKTPKSLAYILGN